MKLTRQQLTDYCNTYGDDRDRLAKDLRTIFADPSNIILFGFFCFPHHIQLESPEFHEELIEIINLNTNVGIGAPRGHAKSTVVNLVYLSWCLVTQRHHYIISISDTYSQSVGFVNTLRHEIEDNAVLKWLYGDLRGDMWQDGKFETSTGVMVQARAYGMKIRGLKYRQYRPELLLFDDLENDESVLNAEQRSKLKKWFTMAALPALSRDGRAVVVGTILHGDSLLKNIIDKQGEFSGWTTKLYKALNYFEDYTYPLWPDSYSVDDLLSMRDNPQDPKYIGSLVFAQEYQNEPIDEKDAIIKREWIKRCDALPAEIDILQRAIFVDPAISKSEQADFTAKIAVAMDRQDNLYIYRIGNDRLSFIQSVQSIFDWYQDEKPRFIGIEKVAFQQALIEVTKGLPVVELEPDKDKIRRALAVSRFFEAGQVYIMRGIENAELMIDQLVHFPMAKHDDLCFVAGTQILTDKGNVPIEQINVNDMVMTRSGYHKVLSTMSRKKPVITNIGLTGTPDHPIFTHAGIKPLQYVNASDKIYIWNTLSKKIERRSYTKAKSIIATQILQGDSSGHTFGDTINGKSHRSLCIDKSGLIILVKYLKNMLFTIRMEIQSIMSYIILNVCHSKSTPQLPYLKTSKTHYTGKDKLSIYQRLENKLKYGMLQRQGISGIRNMQKGLGINHEKSYVWNVIKKPYSIPRELYFAQKNAVQDILPENGEKITPIITKTETVYNLSIDQEHEYFANNILVHNCDAIVYAVDKMLVKRIGSYGTLEENEEQPIGLSATLNQRY